MICDKCGSYNKDGMPGCFNCMVGGGIAPGYPKGEPMNLETRAKIREMADRANAKASELREKGIDGTNLSAHSYAFDLAWQSATWATCMRILLGEFDES